MIPETENLFIIYYLFILLLLGGGVGGILIEKRIRIYSNIKPKRRAVAKVGYFQVVKKLKTAVMSEIFLRCSN